MKWKAKHTCWRAFTSKDAMGSFVTANTRRGEATCPACAQRRLVEWLESKARFAYGPFPARFPEDANMVVFDKDKLDWQVFRKEVGLQEASCGTREHASGTRSSEG